MKTNEQTAGDDKYIISITDPNKLAFAFSFFLRTIDLPAPVAPVAPASPFVAFFVDICNRDRMKLEHPSKWIPYTEMPLELIVVFEAEGNTWISKLLSLNPEIELPFTPIKCPNV